MKKIIKNFTPHNVEIVKDGKVQKSFKSEGVARCIEESHNSSKIICGVGEIFSLTQKKFSKVENLPEEVENTYLIVSLPVAQALPNRSDLIIPHGLVRDDKGNIIGCEGFAQIK